MRFCNCWYLIAGLLAAVVTLPASPIYYVTTDQSGAQTQVDVNHTSSWAFNPATQFDLGGGKFQMKSGGSNPASITLALYQGTDATGPLLGSFMLSNAAFCAQASCSQFNQHSFLFTTAIPLSVGTDYFVTLTSQAVDSQAGAYFIKSANSFISDGQGNTISSTSINVAAAAVPEPATSAMTAAALLGLLTLGARKSASR